jgi:hypothetical protein
MIISFQCKSTEDIMTKPATRNSAKSASARKMAKPAGGTNSVKLPPHTLIPPENQALIEDLTGRAFERREELRCEGKLLSSVELAKRLGLTRQAVTNAVRELRMFSLEDKSGKKLYPAFFAWSDLDRSDLEKVTKRLGQLPGESKWQFFSNPRLSHNGQTPIEALTNGHLDAVMAAAGSFAEA